MLLQLHIVNYTIIKDVVIDFQKGFNVITGETGAGKSILLGALSLILGERAESVSLLDKDKKCIVEGVFAFPENMEIFLDVFRQLDLDPDNEILIRREVSPNGKSRAFINDSPVNLIQLKQVSSLLVDLHQQFDTLELGDSDFQRNVVDSLANNKNALLDFRRMYRELSGLSKEIAALKEAQFQRNKTLDYNRFIYQELTEANLRPGLLEQMEEELKFLNNAESLKSQLLQITNILQEGDQPIVQQMKTIVHQIKQVAGFHKDLASLQQRLEAVVIETADIAADLEQLNEQLHYDAEKIELLNDKINIGYKLLKKHNVQTTAQLLEIMEALEGQLNNLTHAEETIKQKEHALKSLTATVVLAANALHEKRVAIASPLEKEINILLHQVGMPNAKVKIEISPASLHEFGSSTISFLFNANASKTFEPLKKVASGGELSRLMLCIKSLVANAMQLPVLIFDEIDTGISGEAAKQVGRILSGLSVKHQVICITHQAQIAARGDIHFFVYKAIEKNHITTGIKVLPPEERVTAIAQMLSGEKPTEAAIQNAREMVGL